jgi:hypothetical protein
LAMLSIPQVGQPLHSSDIAPHNLQWKIWQFQKLSSRGASSSDRKGETSVYMLKETNPNVINLWSL